MRGRPGCARLPRRGWRTGLEKGYGAAMSGAREQQIEYHKNGSIHAKGDMLDGVPDGHQKLG